MTAAGVVGEVAGGRGPRHPRGRSPALALGPCRQLGSRGDGLETAEPAAGAGRAVRVDDDVADVPRVPVGPVEQPAAQDQTSAHAGRDDHAEHALPAPAGPAPVLADSDADRVVVHAYGTTGEHRLEPRPQREVAPDGDVQRRDLAGRPAHRTAAADTDAGDLAVTRGDQAGHHGLQRGPDRLGVGPRTLRRGRPGGAYEAALTVDQSRGDLGPTHVDGEHVRHRVLIRWGHRGAASTPRTRGGGCARRPGRSRRPP